MGKELPVASNNVLLPIALPTRNVLRKALADIVRSIQLQHGLTDDQLAGELHISPGTVANVRNERTDLNQETIAKIAARFGVEALDPWSACFGGRNVPREAPEAKVSLTAVTGGLHKLALATDPQSDGGAAITHRELATMVPDLKAMQRLTNTLLARAEALGIAA
jgi:transcriptional regulator with XRE-family HTH domain